MLSSMSFLKGFELWCSRKTSKYGLKGLFYLLNFINLTLASKATNNLPKLISRDYLSQISEAKIKVRSEDSRQNISDFDF